GRLLGVQVAEAVVEVGSGGGLTAAVQLQAKAGHEGAGFPSAQGLSSLDAADFAGIGEAWVEWSGGSSVEARLKV
ncbi:MAG: hypothetical protein GWM90_32535, partial [Gemmatimonadetes bacterium]|nr:hypothetical protein [Gemmatimonadota bacterium]NIQ60012.1 hypothetical protein [Gemmatimonadota bacterium]NIU80233.1 hypothetical protein [Gammaproteobacteria bacterium]NIX48616.1 hypothetical protein [Gemmatimonadota bacterium]NIY13063.1 hypothetical protein [Gemmatimonadota bacterium]